MVLVTDKFDLSYKLDPTDGKTKKWAPPVGKLQTRNEKETRFKAEQSYITDRGAEARRKIDEMQNFSVAIIDTWELDRYPGPYHENSRDVPNIIEGPTIDWRTANEMWRKVWSKNVDDLVNKLTFDEPCSNCGYLFRLEMPEGVSADEKQIRSTAQFAQAFERISALLSGGGGVDGDEDE